MSPEYRKLMCWIEYNEAMFALTKAMAANHPDQHIWHAYCVGLAAKPPSVTKNNNNDEIKCPRCGEFRHPIDKPDGCEDFCCP